MLRLGQRVALFERAETTQQEVVHAITAGTHRGTFQGMAGHRRDREVTESAVPPAGAPEREQAPDQSLSAYMREWWQGVKYGELGSLPLIIGLGIIVVTFGLLDDTFLTERNFTNLLLQTAAIATIAIGVVFVLLIGEIDLSVAFVERRRRRRHDTAPAPGRSRLALVAGDPCGSRPSRRRSASCRRS